MKQFLEAAEYVLTKGRPRGKTVQGVPDLTVCGYTMRFDLSDGFPLMTTKKMSFKNVLVELLWFLTGDSRLDFMHQHNVHFWDQWATKEVGAPYGLGENDIGRIYGKQWVDWRTRNGGSINQISVLIEDLRKNPTSRRHLVTTWNPEDVDHAFLAPCHGIFKCHVADDGVLNLHLFQRSGDLFIGIPYNIASYSLLLLMLAQVTGLKAGEFVHTISDLHLYNNHQEQIKLQLTREPRALPAVAINSDVVNIFSFSADDFTLSDYNPHSFIRGDVAL
jgi:thymidylate synthase